MRRASEFMSRVVSYLPGRRSGDEYDDYKSPTRVKGTSQYGLSGASASRRDSSDQRGGTGTRKSVTSPYTKSSSRASTATSMGVSRSSTSSASRASTTFPKIDKHSSSRTSTTLSPAASPTKIKLDSTTTSMTTKSYGQRDGSVRTDVRPPSITRESAMQSSRGGVSAGRSRTNQGSRVPDIFSCASPTGTASETSSDTSSSVFISSPTKLGKSQAPTSRPYSPKSVATTSSPVKKSLCCDKCDGKHETDDCPHYRKSREEHPDAQKNFYKKLGGSSILPGGFLSNARVVRQPGDGSCLFHSMSYGLKDGSAAGSLRSDICSFIQNNPTFSICDTPLSDWVKWDSQESCASYARRMSRSGWGGGIEMACVAQIRKVNVHVYEKSSSGYKRISAFDYSSSPERRPTVRVLYCGGVHYDALVA